MELQHSVWDSSAASPLVGATVATRSSSNTVTIDRPARASGGGPAPAPRAAARKTASVLLADERSLQRVSIAAWLSADPSLELISKVSKPEDVASIIVDARPDAVLLACDLPTHPYIALAARAHRLSPSTRVVVLSTEHNARSCRAAAACGASAHVSLVDPPEELLAALRGRPVAGGGRCVTLEHDPAQGPGLSAREQEVLVHLARGMSAKQAAAALGICPKTVDNHTQRLMKKLDLHSRADVVLFAVREGYITP